MKITVENASPVDTHPSNAPSGSAWLVNYDNEVVVIIKIHGTLFVRLGEVIDMGENGFNDKWHDGWKIIRELKKGESFTVTL